jgi:hypothetical protein
MSLAHRFRILDASPIQHRRAGILVGLPKVQANSIPSDRMMKNLLLAAAAAIASMALVWGGVYVCGLVLAELGIRLYHSEADQQRNFNIVVTVSVIAAIVGGWLGYHLGNKRRAAR